MVGKTLGKYRIVEKIGRGGMGIVYRGVDETLDRQVAIKAISPELVEDDLVRRFRAEAVTLARVNHPNIATVFELFRDDEQLLMVMELVTGQTFEQLIDRMAPMPVERATTLTGQILDALSHAHRAGIVHRDLKPANLMLTDAGIVKVMDFGIARVAGTERMTNDGFMVGTPAYMAPEQVRGDDVDGRADLYAVGVVFYRLLTGKLPFRAETAVSMIQAQLNDAPTPARQVRHELPDWLDAVLMRALAKRPADRYQTADEFRRALASLDELGALAPLPDDITVATPSAPVRTLAAASVPSAVEAPVPSTVEGPAVAPTPAGPSPTTTLVLNRSHLAVAGGFALMLLAVIGLLAWVALRQPSSNPVQVVTIPAPAQPAPQPAQAAATPAPAPAPAPPPPGAPQAPATGTAPPRSAPIVPTEIPVPPAMRGPFDGAQGRRGVPGSPLDEARGRPLDGARGRRGGTGPSATGEFAPMVLRDQHAVVTLGGGRGSRLVEAIVAFSEKSLTATDTRNGFTVKTFPYAAVAHATLSRSRRPRTTGGATLEIPGLPDGNIFARGPRLWMTIETADDKLVLRLEPPQIRPLTDLLTQRTKAPVERYMEPEQP